MTDDISDLSELGSPREKTMIKPSLAHGMLFFYTPSNECPKATDDSVYSLHNVHAAMYQDPLDVSPTAIIPRTGYYRHTSAEQAKWQSLVVKPLPGDERYVTTSTVNSRIYLIVWIFIITAFASEFQLPVAHSVPPPPSSTTNRSAKLWTTEEDARLLVLVQGYNRNWALIAECLARPLTFPVEVKTPWDCSARFEHLTKRPERAEATKANTLEDMKRKATRHLHFFESVAKVIKKRDAQKPSNAGANKKVSLTAHVSHAAIATRAGVDPKRYRTPLEHNERRWSMQQLNPEAIILFKICFDGVVGGEGIDGGCCSGRSGIH